MVLIREHRKEDYCTKSTTVNPDRNGDCPLWKRFLARIMGNDQDMVDYLQRVCGYCLTGCADEHAIFFLWGPGSNGKSTFVGVLTSIFGLGPSGYAVVVPISTFTAGQTDQHPTEIAMIRGARLVVAHETEKNRSWAISRLNQLSGGDRVSARFMRQDFFDFQPQCKIMIVGNHKPALHTINEAVRRRFHLIPFKVTFREDEVDRLLPKKLKTEFPQILGWMLKGTEEWKQKGLAPPAVVRAATDAYFLDEDNVGRWIAERCVLDPNGYATLNDLFPSWYDWGMRNNEEVGKQLAKALDTRPELTRHPEPGTKRAGWKGIKIKPREDDGGDAYGLRGAGAKAAAGAAASTPDFPTAPKLRPSPFNAAAKPPTAGTV
jgi:putative DNA primase/helicase